MKSGARVQKKLQVGIPGRDPVMEKPRDRDDDVPEGGKRRK